MGRKFIPVEERVWLHVTKGSPDECWIWQGGKSHNGYGQMTSEGTTVRAHRVTWEIENGPIPVGLEIHHLCQNPACVNPNHLEVVTHEKNMHEFIPPNKLKTHCPKGHPYDEENTYIVPTTGWRQCKTCRRRG